MREIYKEDSGICDICCKWKPTICFEEEERGWEGYHVTFDICKDCFLDLIEKEDE